MCNGMKSHARHRDVDITRLGRQFSFRFLVTLNTNLQCVRSSSRSDDDEDVVNNRQEPRCHTVMTP